MLVIFITLLGAFVGTIVMASLMYALVWEGFGHGDVIRALGSEATDKPRRFFNVGLILYLSSGIWLSGLYYYAFKFFHFDSVIIALFLGAGMGFIQGFLFMHFYVAEVGLHHPFAQFSTHWLPLAFAHWVCHLLFGVSIGSMLATYMIHGMQAFAISILVNLAFASLVILMARKARILSAIRSRQH